MGLRTKITNTYKKSGLALVEAVVAVSILLIIFVGVISAYNYYLYLSINNIPLVKAAYLAEEVRRNADKDISDSGDVDDNIRKVTIAVSWQDGRGTTTKKISTYVTNLFKN